MMTIFRLQSITVGVRAVLLFTLKHVLDFPPMEQQSLSLQRPNSCRRLQGNHISFPTYITVSTIPPTFLRHLLVCVRPIQARNHRS